MKKLFIQQLKREWLVSIRQLRLIINACLFFLMMIIFFPLTLPPNIELMRTILPGVLWMAVLLGFLLSADHLFQQDYENGVLEQWLVSGCFLPALIIAKVGINWLLNVLPILTLCPLIALLFNLTLWETVILISSLICATPALIFLSALAAVFGVGINQKGALMSLILLPLSIPILIFGSATLIMAMQGLPVAGYLALLTAISIISVSFLPFAISAVIGISLAD